MWFRNHYRCDRCGTSWTDEWSCCCDDDCPQCGARHMSPLESEDLTIIIDEDDDGTFAVLCSPDSASDEPDYDEVARFPTKAEARAYADSLTEAVARSAEGNNPATALDEDDSNGAAGIGVIAVEGSLDALLAEEDEDDHSASEEAISKIPAEIPATANRQSRAERIRALNDAFRSTLDPKAGRVMLTAGVDALPSDVKATAIRKVATFSDFSPDNDPHGEHDFGSFDLAGHTFFWKLDYYDEALAFGSNDPADPEQTIRVLTLMLAAEY